MTSYNRYTKSLMSAKVLNPTIEIQVVDKNGGFTIDPLDDNRNLLEECRKLYESFADFRKNRIRGRRYAFGKQWEDKIQDPDEECTVKYITEREYMERQGFVPLTNNQIRKVMKSVLGVYRSNRREPQAIARDYDESLIGDMMSVALQYVYQSNEAHELNARNLEEGMISGMVISGVRCRWDSEKQRFDISISNENPSRVFFNGDVQDIRMKDIRIIGFIRDYTEDELCQDFAKSDEDKNRILGYYATIKNQSHSVDNPALNAEYTQDNTDFFVPSDPSKHRVIEVWRLESKSRLRCHDLMKGETFVCETTDKEAIDKINGDRAMEAISMGVAPEDVPVIRYEWFIDQYWVGRWFTPNADLLLAVESPFEHNSHPYVVRCYPLIDGEIHSFIDDIIPQQRQINRYISMMDYIRQSSAKGVLIFPKSLKPKNLSEKEIAKAWTKANSVIFADMKPGDTMPQQFNSPAVNSGDTELLNIQMQLLEDISGVHAAIMGKSASASTPSSLYAQEAQNASNNLLDIIEWYDGFVRARDYKVLKTIIQFYDEPRYIGIAGHEYSEAAKKYNPSKVRDVEMDMAISEAMATPAYRLIIADKLERLLEQGFIDVEMFLKGSKIQGSDRILAMIESRKQEMQAQQQQQAPQGGGEPQPDGESVVDAQEQSAVPTNYADKTHYQRVQEALNNGLSPQQNG